MRIKIALIGPTHFCQRALLLTENRKDIELIPYEYASPKDAGNLVQTIIPCDVILFSGSLPFAYAKSAINNIAIPTLYLKQDERAVAVTLLYLSTKFKYNLNRISIDVREKIHLDHIVNDVNGEIQFPYVYTLKEQDNIQNIVAYHEQLIFEQKTDAAITSVHAVHEELIKTGIPVYKMIDPESALLDTIEEAKQKAILHKSTASQIAIGKIKGTQPNYILEPFVTKIADFMQAAWSENVGHYDLFTTTGIVENIVKDKAFLRLIQKMPRDIKLAFGTGENLQDATENAKSALDFAAKYPGRSLYLLDADKKLHGPYPVSTDAVQMKVDEPSLVEVATNTKLSPANISKLIQFGQSRQAKQFTANDLSLYLNVSRRTAERILKKLMEFQYVKIVGEEMAYKQGRPRALYELNFATYQ
ncbi:hypothetical protein [Sporosarcina koreensis]|uniref:hypothetical protein n=1 Tax=Bacillales TaxID=1385 RepID=UPI00075B7045|nr:hypothetical protein [Sporosarcina koreensis]